MNLKFIKLISVTLAITFLCDGTSLAYPQRRPLNTHLRPLSFKEKKTPGAQLRSLREQSGLTRAELATMLRSSKLTIFMNLSEPVISNWENKLTPIPPESFAEAKRILLKKIGLRFRSFRKQLGFTQAEFGKMLNPTKPIKAVKICAWEKGKMSIPPEIFAEAERVWSREVGLRLRSFRIQLGLRDIEFGEMLGVSGPTISRWENGLTPIPLKIFVKVKRVWLKKAGLRLRLFREQAGFTEVEFAKMLGVPTSVLCKWEKGKRAIPPEILAEAERLTRKERGLRLRSFRIQANLSLSQFGQMLGISKSVLHKWEKGKRAIPPETFAKAERCARKKMGLRFKSFRIQLELTKDGLGERLGVSGQTISNWEKGKTPIPPEIFAKVKGRARKKVALRFKSFMKRSGLSWVGFSKKLHVSRSTIFKWRNGIYPIPPRILAMMAAKPVADLRPITRRSRPTRTLDEQI